MELVGNTFFFQWEVSLMIWLQSFMGSFETALASFISEFGEVRQGTVLCLAVRFILCYSVCG